jgi:perosamine synthetase
VKELAINGGKKLHDKPWSTGAFHIKEEIEVLQQVLSGPALPMARGPRVMGLREQLQACYGMRYAVPVSSGSAAIHVALYAAGVGAGDEVIVSPLTDYGSIIGIFQLNAIPVFADVLPDSLLLDVDSIAKKITARTKVIMPVHNGGYAVDMRALMRLAKKRGVKVVEDCAQAHLAMLGKKYLGTYGDMGAWSFNESKHMKAGEGGFVLTNNKALAQAADLFADKCYPRFVGAPPTPAFPALNVRLNEINAALAAVQLKHLPKWIEQRRRFAEAFHAGIKDVAGVHAEPQPKGSNPSYWWVSFAVDADVLGVDAGRFCEMLSAEGIPSGARVQQYVPGWQVFRTLHEDPDAFASYRPGRLKKKFYPLGVAPIAQKAAAKIGAIRMTQHNTIAEARAAAKAVQKIVRALIED